MIKSILEFIYPYQCPFCRDVIKYKGEICDVCMDKLPEIKGYDIKKGLSRSNYIDDVYSCFFYEGSVRSAMINFKSYNNKNDFYKQDAIIFSEIFIKLNSIIAINGRYDIICCVPSLHFNNHSMLFCKQIALKLGVPFHSILKKVRNNKKQHLLNFEDRLKNIKGVFEVPQDKVSFLNRKNVLLVDDVITTGGTVNECCRVLKLNGAIKVDVCSVAVTKFT